MYVEGSMKTEVAVGTHMEADVAIMNTSEPLAGREAGRTMRAFSTALEHSLALPSGVGVAVSSPKSSALHLSLSSYGRPSSSTAAPAAAPALTPAAGCPIPSAVSGIPSVCCALCSSATGSAHSRGDAQAPTLMGRDVNGGADGAAGRGRPS